MKKLLFLFHLTFLSVSAQQNLNTNFAPLKSSGELPPAFTQNIRNVIEQDISEIKSKKDSDKRLKYRFMTASNYEIERIIRSGNALINDEVSGYLNQIADIVLKDNAELRKKLNLFTLKSQVVNAYSYEKGFIFIDLGLVAQAETEAQLAYIICHEISHYVKHHQINGYVKNEQIDRQNYDGQNSEQRVIEKCQYSKEQESEADIEGFSLFERSAYNLKQAEKTFDMLQYSHLPFEMIEFKKSFFETENYSLPKRYFLKDVSAIKDNSHEDDTKHTHPNTSKRKLAIAELIAKSDNNKRVNTILGQKNFEYIRDLARMEICRLHLKQRDYPNAFYSAYILSKKYPNNQYLAEVIAKCLYGISLFGKGMITYSDYSYLEYGFTPYADVESYPQQFYYMINKMPENEWTILSLNHIYRSHKRFPENKVISSLTDSMFSLIKYTDWGISDFARKEKSNQIELKKDTVVVSNEPDSKTEIIAGLQKTSSTNADDTVYYKYVFLDLFLKDPEFVSKFPPGPQNQDDIGAFPIYSRSPRQGASVRKNKNLKKDISIQKVILFEPFYLKIDETQNEEIQYVTSDKKQESYSETVNNCAGLLDVELIALDPNLLNANEVDKINDYSVINDWFDEKFDTDREKIRILNTDDIDQVINKYGTQYVLKTGLVYYVNSRGKKRTYFYGFLFDIKNNELLYRKYENFASSDRKDLVNAKTYQMLFELKHPGKK